MKNLSGKTFGRLTALYDSGNRSKCGKVKWICRCSCGNKCEVRSTCLTTNNTTSCGCRKKETQFKETHGLSRTRKYKKWKNKKRYIVIKDRTPSWADRKKMREIYENCPKGKVVDHIVPLQGDKVSGLHVENNLQYLTLEENCKKGNKYEY